MVRFITYVGEQLHKSIKRSRARSLIQAMIEYTHFHCNIYGPSCTRASYNL